MRVAVAMSGGVDSSVAAYLLHKQGVEVVGMSMHLYNLDLPDTAKFDTCCSLADLDQARRVADDLGFAHFTVDYTVSFEEEVVRPFIDQYARGQTPNPCVRCNDRVKFRPLLEHAARLGCTHLATGHYAKVCHDQNGRGALYRPVDQRKDQTYFLFSLDAEQLGRTLFPLGDMTKDEVRDVARAAGMVNANKPESQDICFIPDGDIVKFLDDEIAHAKPGRILDSSGQQLGTHAGIHRYTVGQRRGLGVSSTAPLYVSQINGETGDLVVTDRDGLFRHCADIEDVRWIDGEPRQAITADVQVRYRSRPLPARIEPNGNRARIRFSGDTGEVISPGQAAVFYDGDRVLGGGWICSGVDEAGSL